MAALEKVIQLEWTPELLAAFLPSVKASPWGGLDSPGTVLGYTHLFEHRHAGERVLLATRPVQCDYGLRCDVVGLRSLGDRFTASALNHSVHEVARAYGADMLAMCTRRGHLVKACQAHGWTRSGSVVTKLVNPQ